MAREETRQVPEVTLLRDGREGKPENAVGIGEFWYEPEVWSLPLSPAARVLYAGLCSYLGPGEINRQDLRNTLKGNPDAEILAAFGELSRHGLLEPAGSGSLPGYRVRSVGEFEG